MNQGSLEPTDLARHAVSLGYVVSAEPQDTADQMWKNRQVIGAHPARRTGNSWRAIEPVERGVLVAPRYEYLAVSTQSLTEPIQTNLGPIFRLLIRRAQNDTEL